MLKVSSASLCLLLHSRSRFWNARSSLHRCPSVGRRLGGKARVRRMPAQLLPPLCRLGSKPWRQRFSRPDWLWFRVVERQHGSSTTPAIRCTHRHQPVLTHTAPHVQVAGAGWLASAASHAINVQVSIRVSSVGRGLRAERRFGRPRVRWQACTPVMPSRGWVASRRAGGAGAWQAGCCARRSNRHCCTLYHVGTLLYSFAEQRGAARLWHRLRRGLRPAGRPVPVSRCRQL